MSGRRSRRSGNFRLSLPSVIAAHPLSDVNSIVLGRHGYFLANRFDHYLGLALIMYGEYGEREWLVLAQLVAAGDTVVEVGANIGSITVPLAKAVGPTGRVIAVEPQRVIHQYLCANIALNTLANVETHQVGCGAEPGEMVVPAVPYFTPGRQNFGAVALSTSGEGEPVHVLRLDDIMMNRGAKLIKIDVEGMEAEVLHGAAHLIASSRPVLYLENDRVEKSDALISLLWQLSYRTYWHVPLLFNPDNFFHNPEDIYGTVRSCNMLCIPRESARVAQGFPEITSLGGHPFKPAPVA
jgi:FkbM family methyltransferase